MTLRRFGLPLLLMGGTKITDAGLAHLKSFPELRKISLFETQVTDAGLEHLKALPKLEVALLAGSKVTEEGKKSLLAANPKLRLEE